jgi:hypothetical protein
MKWPKFWVYFCSCYEIQVAAGKDDAARITAKTRLPGL